VSRWPLPFLLLLTACEPAGYKEAKEAVRYGLKDPDSAQFRELRRCARNDGVEGEVNSKNSYGAYAGFEPFIYVKGRVAIGYGAEGFGELQNLCYSEEVIAASNAMIAADKLEDGADAAAGSAVPDNVAAEAPDLAQPEAVDQEAPSEAAAAEECWQDYCPCEESGEVDVMLCRNIRGGVEVTPEMMASGAAMRDARKSLEKFKRENPQF
jgi:hypothetical protein